MASRVSTLVDAFRGLDFYQMGRFSEMLLCKLESQVEGQLLSKTTGQLLDEKDVKAALADALRFLLHETTTQKLSNDLVGMYGSHLLAVV